MRRVAAGTLTTLALAACVLWSAGGSVAARPTRASNRPTRASNRLTRASNRPTRASNRADATTAAARLLGLTPLPSGATASSADPENGAWLHGSTAELAFLRVIDDHGFWRVPGDPQTVIAWIQAHPPSGSTVSTTSQTGQNGTPVAWSVTFAFSAPRGRIAEEVLGVGVTAAIGGGTAMRADGAAVWLVPRSAGEVVPRGVRAIEVFRDHWLGREARRVATVTSRARIARVIRFVDSREIVQPGTVTSCPEIGPQTLVLDLRFVSGRIHASGRPLARVLEDACGGLSFWIRGRRETPLSEAGDLGRLVGVRGR